VLRWYRGRDSELSGVAGTPRFLDRERPRRRRVRGGRFWSVLSVIRRRAQSICGTSRRATRKEFVVRIAVASLLRSDGPSSLVCAGWASEVLGPHTRAIGVETARPMQCWWLSGSWRLVTGDVLLPSVRSSCERVQTARLLDRGAVRSRVSSSQRLPLSKRPESTGGFVWSLVPGVPVSSARGASSPKIPAVFTAGDLSLVTIQASLQPANRVAAVGHGSSPGDLRETLVFSAVWEVLTGVVRGRDGAGTMT
jgi:hypothetical protein